MEKIIARNSGQLEKIWVKNGDTVKVSERMAVLENLANTNDIYKLKRIVDSVPSDFQSFSFPILETSKMILGDVGNAYVDFEKTYVDYRLLRNLQPYEIQLKNDQKSLSEIKVQLADQMRQKSLLDKEYKLKQIDFDRYKKLFEKGVISSQELESRELEFIQMQKQLNSMAISISQMRGAISLANRTVVETSINEQEDNMRLTRNLAQSYNNLKKAIKQWEDNYLLSSSINGVVSFQGFWGVNQFVNSNDLVFSVLPVKKDSLVGKLSIASQNAGKVMVGQKVLIKLDNFPYEQFGMLIGYVTSISVSPDSSGNYALYISLPNGTTTSYGRNFDFSQELLGTAEIITENLSIAERIFFSFREIFKYGQ